MSEYTPRWLGIIRGFKTNGSDPWQVSIEMPEGPGIFNGTGPTVSFERGQRVHVLTDEGLAAMERAAKEEGWAEGYGDCWDYHVSEGAIGRQANPYSKTKEEHDD